MSAEEACSQVNSNIQEIIDDNLAWTARSRKHFSTPL